MTLSRTARRQASHRGLRRRLADLLLDRRVHRRLVGHPDIAGPALTATHKKALDQFVQAEIADIRGDSHSAEMHRQNAVNALREAHDVAGEYEALWREQPTSFESPEWRRS